MDKNVIKLFLGKLLKEFINAILAGLMISLGATVYMFCSSMGVKIVGAFMFTTGILLVLLYGYSLITGKMGYLLENKGDYVLECIVSFIGNYVGTFFAAGLLSLTRICDTDNAAYNSGFMGVLEGIVDTKMNDGVLSLIVLGIFCGMLVYFAVNTYKKADMQLARIVTLFVTIGLFCICGFEHCVADMFYFNLYALTHRFASYGVLIGKMFYVALGNLLGCILIPAVRILRSKIKSL